MCAIVDVNVAPEVFGDNPSPVAEKFFEWLERGGGRLVVGGKLLEELEENSPDFRRWGQAAQLAGKMTTVNKEEVDARTRQIERGGAIRSDDPHILALAQVSGARLLYSNDRNLGDDFRDRTLIDNPPGRVYTTRRDKNAPQALDNTRFRRSHRELLKRNVCRKPD